MAAMAPLRRAHADSGYSGAATAASAVLGFVVPSPTCPSSYPPQQYARPR